MANFSEMPEELIGLFLKRLSCLEDFVISGAVCKSWQSVGLEIRKTQCFAPWLMLTNDETDLQNLRSFSCLSRRREFTIKLPDIRDRRCWGSPFGWLITFGIDFNIHLVNPLSGVRLSLPPRKPAPGGFQPEPGRVRQSCPRDETWTAIDTPVTYHEDAIYFKGQLYTVDVPGMLILCDIDAPQPKGIMIGSSTYPNRNNSIKRKVYLVEICEELHLIVRNIKFAEDEIVRDSYHHTTLFFRVYKFDYQTKTWTEVANLGDHALFVGSNTTFVISTCDFPEYTSNVIYDSDDHSSDFHKGFCDMSMYDCEKKTFKPFYFGFIHMGSPSRSRGDI